MWTREYDQTLQMYYYINMEDNSISYDSPCEVVHSQGKISPFNLRKKCKTTIKNGKSYENSTLNESSKNSVFSKLTSVLSRKSSRSSAQSEACAKQISSEHLYNPKSHESAQEPKLYSPIGTPEYNNSIISGFDEEFLLEKPPHYYTTNANYPESYLSEDEESIRSFYSDLKHNEYQYEQDSVYDLEKEKERIELRQQIRQELGF